MPLYQVADETLDAIAQSDFDSDNGFKARRENLLATFNCRFIATEFSTGEVHRGRIDTLALSEDNNPVIIIEYKKIRSSDLLTQSFYYLGWLKDHKGDFELLTRRILGDRIEIDWSDIRVICLARDYSKFERTAAREMGGYIELWQYRLFANSCFYLEEIHMRTRATTTTLDDDAMDPVMVAAGKKEFASEEFCCSH